jgi:hypothetical protein
MPCVPVLIPIQVKVEKLNGEKKKDKKKKNARKPATFEQAFYCFLMK